MPTDAPPILPEMRYDIAYQEFTGSKYNHDLRGKGELVIRPEGPTFVFAGTKRGTLGREGEITFAADQIWNVTVEDRRVQFSTGVGVSGAKKIPFLFFCTSAAEAAAIAALLPRGRDADFVAGMEFAERLNQLRGSRSPWSSITNLIVLANVVVFVLMGLAGAGWFEVADMMPYIRYGANRADITTDGEWWRLITSMFIHYGVVHLGLNMWALYESGQLAEKLFGRTAYLLAYLGSGITGSLASLLWHRHDLVWSAGASGAVFGVYGALLGYMVREKHALPKNVYQPLFKSTIAFAGYNLLFGAARSGIDNAGHLGGLAGGFLLGWLLALPVDAEVRSRLLPQRLRHALLAFAGVVVAGILLAPRFDYHLVDEIAWHDANKAATAKEPEVIKRQLAALKAVEQRKDSSEAVRWLRDEAIPFYDGWQKDLANMKLTAGQSTDRRREGLAEILRHKVQSFERLLRGLQQDDADALTVFRSDEQKIEEELKSLRARKN